MAHLDYRKFSEIDLNEAFFSSLKDDYQEFSDWFLRKATQGEAAYVLYDDSNRLTAFLYLKVEDEEVDDINPPMLKKKRLKVGTLKIEAHGTRLGERVIKKIMDNATERGIDEIYVTIFPKHDLLIKGLKKYGFVEAGEKLTHNGLELVLVKYLNNVIGEIYSDYPVITARGKRIWSLSIYPPYHTQLFPDSILNNESYDLLNDIAPTNTIRKVYISKIECTMRMRPGDVLFMYRTTDGKGAAHYRSVITSVCVVEEVTNMDSFASVEEYVQYCKKSSIFSEEELRGFYLSRRYPYILRMTYNAAFHRRVIKKDLMEQLGINPSYWGCFELTVSQAQALADMGRVSPLLMRW